MKRMLMVIASVLLLASCGDLDERMGTYQGQWSQTTKTNFGMRTEEVTRVVSVLVDEDGEPSVGLQIDCQLPGKWDGDAVVIDNASCSWSNEVSSETWKYTGKAQLNGQSVTLSLEGTFVRRYADKRPDLEGSYSLTFDGTRR